MAEYIDREALIKAIENDCLEQVYYSKEDAIWCVKAADTVDAVEVVRCKDCKWYEPTIYIPWNIEEHRWEREKTTHHPFGECHGQCFTFTEDGDLRVGENDFCSCGERKEKWHQ